MKQQNKNTSRLMIKGVPFTMVFVKGGTFWMGAQRTDPKGRNYDPFARMDECPVHEVTIPDFWIGEYPVTQLQWKTIMHNNPSQFGHGDYYPVSAITCDTAAEFCYKLSKKSGIKYRLPSEEEWEYAARGGIYNSNFRYSGSDNIDTVAWHNGNSEVCGINSPRPVGLLLPNALGIYDMSGNVLEWCKSRYEPYTWGGWSSPDVEYCNVMRGGCWLSETNAGDCRVASRSYWASFEINVVAGLRLVCN